MTTAFQGVTQDPQKLCAAHRAVKGIVGGHWLNVTDATKQVAVDFLELVGTGGC